MRVRVRMRVLSNILRVRRVLEMTDDDGGDKRYPTSDADEMGTPVAFRCGRGLSQGLWGSLSWTGWICCPSSFPFCAPSIAIMSQ